MPDLFSELLRRAIGANLPDVPKPPQDLPRPYTMYPAFERARANVSKAFPADMRGNKTEVMPWNDLDAFTSTMAGTDPPRFPTAGDTSVNPGVAMIYPQDAIESTLAHELQHRRDMRSGLINRDTPAEANPGIDFKAYQANPMEVRARKAETDWEKSHPQRPLPKNWEQIIHSQLLGLPTMLSMKEWEALQGKK